MAKIRRLQTHFQVCFWAVGEKLSPDRVNPLLEKFAGILKGFKIEKENYSAVVTLVGNSIFQEVDTRKVKASSQLTFEIADSRPSADDYLYGLSHEDAAEIHNGLRELSLLDGTYSKRVDIVVKDTFSGSEPPMSRPQSPWPERRF
jgi:hypothetical protein